MNRKDDKHIILEHQSELISNFLITSCTLISYRQENDMWFQYGLFMNPFLNNHIRINKRINN